MSDETLVELDSTRDGVAVVTLARPKVHNAFGAEVIAALDEIFEDLKGADGVRVVRLEAKGKSFSAGADLNWMRSMADYTFDDNEEDAMALATMLHKLHNLPQPTIAVVQGPTLAGGIGLISACDIAIASKAAWFSLSEVKLGLIPATISPYVIEAIGPRAARRYFLTAERFDAEEALRLGLLHQLVDDQAALDALAEDITQAVFDCAPGAIHASKELIDAVKFQPIDHGLMKDTAARIATARASDEGKEGTSSFLEKRKPSWVRVHEELVEGEDG